MELKYIDETSISFAFECMKILRGDANYSYELFSEYICKNFLENSEENHSIFIAYEQGVAIGILTSNRFSMPRYLGFGYELEEVIVDINYQNRGYGIKMIESFFNHIKEQKDFNLVRKVIVKTNNKFIAPKLYKRLFLETDNMVYAKKINHL
jgi:ribosomal protein S18 acetylase RimI-like enzyme